VEVKKQTEIINIEQNQDYAISRAVEIYSSGGIFIYPTDTIYGFGCNPFNKSSMDNLYKLKGRENKKQYILLINSVETLSLYVEVPDKISYVLKKIWPAAVTVILTLKDETGKIVNYSTAAFRVPDNKFCLNVLNKINYPLISTSVNISGQDPLYTSEQIISSDFGKTVDGIFINQNEEPNQPSTLVDLTGDKPVVLRNGKINFMDLWKKFS